MVRRSHSLEWVEPLPGGLESVAGLDIAKDVVEETLDVFSEDARRANIDRPKGLFAGGVPGTGKSYLFAGIVGALRVPGVRMNVGRLFGSLLGESERKLHEDKLILRALAPVAVQIDEFDKAFGGGGDQDGNTSGRVRGEFLTFLQDRGGADVYFYATANNLEMLFERSPEMMRQGRWDDLLFFDLPILEERTQMFEVHARRRQVKGLDAGRLAGETDKFLPAEIENVLVKGMRRAFRDGRRAATTDDLLRQIELRRNSILAVTAKERIAGMRKWAKGRMTFASSAQEKVVTAVTKMIDEGLRGLEA
jgi:SpoVK/Ycf46/Vps4 family AAA+-type ATPase